MRKGTGSSLSASLAHLIRASSFIQNRRVPNAFLAEIVNLYDRLDHALEAAVRKGGRAAEEDDSKGYALIKDPAARSLQLAIREWALKHEPELLRVLEVLFRRPTPPDRERCNGLCSQSRNQILALIRAARDPDDEVRNNATRALGVLVRSGSAFASQIAPDPFIDMLSSGRWSDRNKGAALLMELTTGRNPDLLLKRRAAAAPFTGRDGIVASAESRVFCKDGARTSCGLTGESSQRVGLERAG